MAEQEDPTTHAKTDGRTKSITLPIDPNSLPDFKTILTGWNKEAELVNYIECNIVLFTKDVLGEEYQYHVREWSMQEQRMFGGNQPRIDLMIMTKSGKRIGVECKLPKQSFSELSRAVSQVLAYSVIAEDNNLPLHKLLIVTTQYDTIVHKIIKKYELPIGLVVIDKNKRMEWNCEN